MKASLDTNVIIHFYKANLQGILFDFFEEGVYIYEQIRNVELENHGQEILDKVDGDIASEKIELYTDQRLKDLQVYKIFEHQTVKDFNQINNKSNLNWSFKSQVSKFIKRFLKNPYRSEDTIWIRNLAAKKGFSIKTKLAALSKLM